MKKTLNLFFYLSTLLFLALLQFACEKEKDNYVEPQLVTSVDSLYFNGQEIKELIISTNPSDKCEYQIISFPNWLQFSSLSGEINEDLERVQIVSDLANYTPGKYEGKIEIMSNIGRKFVYVTGFVGEHFDYSLSDSIVFTEFGDSQIFTVKNEGNVSLSYSITTSNSILAANTTTGILNVGEQNAISCSLNRTDLITGNYDEKVYVNINNVLDTIDVKIRNFKEQKSILLSDVVDAEYSRSNNNLVYVSSVPSMIHVFNTINGTTNSLELDYIPTCVSLSSDGLTAAVGHDAHITYVDISNLSVIRTYSVSCNVLDIVLSNNQWVYAFPKNDQWVNFLCVNVSLSVDNETSSTGNYIYAGTKAKLHPSGKYIYGADNGLSPSDIEKFDVQNGTANYLYDSPYHGDYLINGDLWFSEDGNRIFTRGKTVLKTSVTNENDLLYNGTISLETSYSRIMYLDHSSVKNNLYIIASTDDYWDYVNKPYIYIYNATNLTYKSKFELEKYLVKNDLGVGTYSNSEPFYVFANSIGDKIYVITKASVTGLPHEWAIQTIKID